MTNFKNARFAVIGAGALGGFYGSLLAHHGYRVDMLMRSAAPAVRADGLTVESMWGTWHVRPQIYESAQEMGVCDVLLISLKTTANAALPEILRHTVGPNTIVLTLQNGLGNEEAILAALPNNAPADAPCRVLGGCSFICSWRETNTLTRHTAGGNVQFAELNGIALPRTHALCEVFKKCGVPCEVKESPAWIRWHKLVWNIPFNGLGLVACADTSIVLATPELKATARELMREIQAIAAAEGVQITDEFCEFQFERTAKMGDYKSSMQIDYEQRRHAEVESILGEPVRRATRHGVHAPLMTMLYATAARLNRQ